jgi:hypothetical protein
VKNRRKAIGIEEKLHVVMWRAKVNELFIYPIMLDSLTVSYIKFVIMLAELQEVLSLELKCLFF